MHRSILVAALLAILLTAAPAPAQTPSSVPEDVPIGGVTEDGYVRVASDAFAGYGPGEPKFVHQYAETCAEAGFPILDARPSDAPVSVGKPSEPATRASAGGPTSAGGVSGSPSLPDTGGSSPLLLGAGSLLAGVGLVARRSAR